MGIKFTPIEDAKLYMDGKKIANVTAVNVECDPPQPQTWQEYVMVHFPAALLRFMAEPLEFVNPFGGDDA